jgi:uncharacterized protein YabE (DUF348 family)
MRIPFLPASLTVRHLLIGGGLLLASVFGSISYVSAATNDTAKSGRLITIHDRGDERVILTHAQTIGDALKDANISVVDEDQVEPNRDEQLVATDYTVNIYRARPVVVVDGAVRQKIMTAAQTTTAIASAANVELHDEDKAALSASDDIVSDGASVVLNVDRATPFTLELYGTAQTTYTQAKTVGEMLKTKHITLAASDTLSVPADTPITPDIKVAILRNGVQTATVEEPIAFPVRQVKDVDQPVGYHKVQTAGTNGRKSVTYQITVQNGKEVSRAAIQTVVLEEAKEQVEVTGTKVSLPAGSHEDWMAAAGIASGDYGYVNYIVSHEGGWVPCKVQGGSIDCTYSGSMGYGVVQATPGSKMASAGSDWRTNPITQLEWATGYAVGRYGSWSGAYNHWLSSHSW